MQTLPLDAEPVQMPGAFDFDRRGDHLLPRRLPEWTRPQVPEVMHPMVTTPSGVRITFTSTTRRIELDTKLTLFAMGPGTPTATFDLTIDGELAQQQHVTTGNIVHIAESGEFRVERGDATTVVFDDLPAGEKALAIWLPVRGQAQLRALRIDDEATVKATPDTRPVWAHYGSSISQCSEADSPTQTWPATAARLGQVSLRSFGFGGQCHLDQFVARTIRDVDAAFISMKVGINIANGDTMRERIFAPALHGFLDTVREGHPATPILLISPIYCPSAEERPGPTIPGANGKVTTLTDVDPRLRNGSLCLRRMRELIEEVAIARVANGDQNLHYLNGLRLFGADDVADLPDDLHPNGAGYRRMGERFSKQVWGSVFNPDA